MVEKIIDVAKESTAQMIYDKVSNIDSKIQTVAEPLEMFNISEYDVSSTDNYGVPPGETILNLKGKVYCINTSSVKSFLYEMDDHMITSRIISELPYPFNPLYSCVLVYRDEIHILGGESSRTSYHEEYINYDRFHYKWDGEKWLVASVLPYSCYKTNAVVYHDEIHILGGESGLGMHDKNHYSWNGVKWTMCPSIPTSFVRNVAFVYNDMICLYGDTGLTGNAKTFCRWNGTSWNNSVVTSNLSVDEKTCCLPCTINGNAYIFFFTSDGKLFRYKSNQFSDAINLSNDYIGSNVGVVGRYCATLSTNNLPIVSIVSKSQTNKNLTSLPSLLEFTSESYFRVVGTLYGVGSQISNYADLTNYGRVVNHQDTLYLFSNYNNGTIFRFDENESKWVKENITRNEIGATTFTFHGIASMDDGIHLVGTVSENYIGCNHFVYRNGQIKLLSNPPFRFLNGSLVNHNGELYAIGGYGMKDSTYNQYKWDEENDTWIAIGRTPYNVYGDHSAVSYKNCIYAIGYSENMLQEYIMVWNNGSWSVIVSKTNSNYTTGSAYSSPVIQTEFECSDCLFIHDNRLCISTIKYNENNDNDNISLLYDILLQSQDSISGLKFSKSVKCSYFSVLKPDIHRPTLKMISYGDNVCVIDTFDGKIRLSNRGYEPIDNGTIKIFIPKGHIIHCSKSVYYPLTPTMKEIYEGFESIKTTYHIFSRTGSGDELNYTIQ